MKNFKSKLNCIEVISLIITIVMVVVITFMEMQNTSIRLMWNDLSRLCDDEAITSKLFKLVTTMVLLISTNLISIVRKVES